ncbi:hypothetical protein ON010_g8554 [Phytophthora cinnamomi]|nr:hypothetical protein ON010_g8554 [Phytophthora cinnamomi]
MIRLIQTAAVSAGLAIPSSSEDLWKRHSAGAAGGSEEATETRIPSQARHDNRAPGEEKCWRDNRLSQHRVGDILTKAQGNAGHDSRCTPQRRNVDKGQFWRFSLTVACPKPPPERCYSRTGKSGRRDRYSEATGLFEDYFAQNCEGATPHLGCLLALIDGHVDAVAADKEAVKRKQDAYETAVFTAHRLPMDTLLDGGGPPKKEDSGRAV